MELIKAYWFIIILGLFAVMFVFGRGKHKGQAGKEHGNEHEGYSDKTASKSGHGCCH